MRKINYLLVTFLVFSLAIAMGGWYFVQSKDFGRTISKIITEISEKELNAKISFKKLEIEIFPPGFIVHHVKLTHKSDQVEVLLDLGSIGVYFDLIDIPRQKVSVDTIRLQNGFVNIVTKEKKESEKVEVFPLVKEALSKLPFHLQGIEVNETIIKVDSITTRVQESRIENHEDDFYLEAKSGLTEFPNWSLYPVDQVQLKAQLLQHQVKIDQAVFYSEMNKIMASGIINEYGDLKKINSKLRIYGEVFLGSLNSLKEIKDLRVDNGLAMLHGEMNLNLEEGISGPFEIEIEDFDSAIIDANKVKGKGRIEKNKIFITSAELENPDEKVKLLKEVEVIDLKTRKHLQEPFYLEAEHLHFKNILQVLGPPLKPLGGELSGRIKMIVKGKDLSFIPDDGFLINHLGLNLVGDDKKKFSILHTKQLSASNTEFHLRNNIFYIKTNLKGQKSNIKIEGSVGKHGVDVIIPSSEISFEDIGDIADMNLKGVGTNEIRVTGPLEHVILDFKGEFTGFEFLDFRLGQVFHDFSVDLKNNEMFLKNVRARKGAYKYSGTGLINFKKQILDVEVNVPQISFDEFADLLHPFKDGFTIMPPDFDAIFSGDIHISSKGDVKKNMVVTADVEAKKITAYNESFDEARFHFAYQNRRMNFENIVGSKEQARALGNLSVQIDEKASNYDFKITNLYSKSLTQIRQLPLEMEFKTDFDVIGFYSPKKYEFEGKAHLHDSVIRGHQVGDSQISFSWFDHKKLLNGHLMGDWIKIIMDPTNDQKKFSGKVLADISDFPLFLIGVFGDNPRLSNATGKFELTTDFSAPVEALDRMTVKTWIKQFNLASFDLKINPIFEQPQINIDQGDIKKWDFEINSEGFNLKSTAFGSLYRKVNIENIFKFDTRYLELFTKYVKRGQGFLDTRLDVEYVPYEFRYKGKFTSSNVSITSDYLPFSINQLNFSANLNDRQLHINNAQFRPENGLVRINGDIFFVDGDPEINLSYALERATFPLKIKSTMTFTGQGLMFGSQRPYLVNGDILVNKTNIINEFNDWMEKDSELEKIKYLPKEKEHPLAGFVKLDLKIDSENPMNMTNSMVDVQMSCDVNMTGDLFKPLLDGRASIIPNTSKVFFKNNDYTLTKGEFFFTSKRAMSQPDFDIVALSTINNYKITARALGTPDSFNFDLVSDPVLSKNSIMSLIAFGYTEDISQSISQEDRQNLTNVGVGSFIFDQFKVTDIIKKQFGLQLNIGTTLMQSNQSMLSSNRAQDTASTGQTRSATKIEIKKRLSESVNLSVSRTVGGSIGQRQIMNINYGISKHLQLQGIYELRTNAEGQEDLIDNSIGGDVKLRWSFK